MLTKVQAGSKAPVPNRGTKKRSDLTTRRWHREPRHSYCQSTPGAALEFQPPGLILLTWWRRGHVPPHPHPYRDTAPKPGDLGDASSSTGRTASPHRCYNGGALWPARRAAIVHLGWAGVNGRADSNAALPKEDP